MANAREIQNRIKSIKDTMKITSAMYMMSSMKLRKAKQKLEDTEPFFYTLQKSITDILLHFPDIQHIYFDNRVKDKNEENKRKAFIVITGDKGMAGAYNHNVIKTAEKLAGEASHYKLYVVGELGRQHFKNRGYNIDMDFRYSPNNPSMHRARVITEFIVDMYNREELDEVYIVYTKMINSIQEDVEVEQLLPLKTHEFIKNELINSGHSTEADSERLEHGDDWYYFYPTPKKVLEKLVYNYVTGFVYGALVEGCASEENARMMAMQSATNNARAMLHDLSIEYNRVRQAAITQEITEVIGGAKALRKKKAKVR